jgi:hypothetical protein
MELRDERVRTGWLVVQTIQRDPEIRVRCRLGKDFPKPTSGYGGWETVDRPHLRKITDWAPNGTEPVRIEVSFLMGDYKDPHNSIEGEFRDLERMAGLDKSGVEPPLVVWEGNAPHDYRENKTQPWYIESLTWDNIAKNTLGNVFCCEGVLTFCSFVEEEMTRLTPSGRNRRAKKKPLAGHDRTSGHKPYTVREGDTLSKIASRRLGRADRWKEIAKLNKLRDPRNIHVGQRLKMP